jgi:hypothetical protein
MPEEGWTSLAVRKHVGATMIKTLAGSQGLTVSDHLERL